MIISMLGDGSAGRQFGTPFAESGYEVYFGAREADPSRGRVTLETAAERADVAVITIPFHSCYDHLPRLTPFLVGKVVIDATNPTKSADWSPILLGEENSGGEEIARLMPASRVVKALNTVFADMAQLRLLLRQGPRFTGFVAADDRTAAESVLEIVQRIGFDPLYVGRLYVSRYLEAMSHLNIELALRQGHGTHIGLVYDLTQANSVRT